VTPGLSLFDLILILVLFSTLLTAFVGRLMIEKLQNETDEAATVKSTSPHFLAIDT